MCLQVFLEGREMSKKKDYFKSYVGNFKKRKELTLNYQYFQNNRI